MDAKPYLSIVSHYEACLEKHGDTHLGVDWPRAEDVQARYQVMLDVIRPSATGAPARLLDFGCGASHLYEYLKNAGFEDIEYSGLDLSPRFVALSRAKFPHLMYHCVDILDEGVELPRFSYVVMNGVLTERRDLSFDEMLDYSKRLIAKAFSFADVGIAFNVMSAHVDWKRDDLFHLPFDMLADFIRADISPHFVIRNDYRLHEYTVYVYRSGT